MATESDALNRPAASAPRKGGNDLTTTGAGIPDWLPANDAVPSHFGKYEVLGEIARGGVGVIYKAKQPGLDRIVALKVLQSGTAASSEQVRRFYQEAQSAAKLQHPNIVPIHDFGVVNGQHYFTMDFVEGESIADMLARGPIPPRDALEIAKQVSEALSYAHSQGVIHRDIKPGNVLVEKTGRAHVTDFGLAKEITSDQMSLTVTGQVMGTPRYMSPEQASGKTAKADARSDVFSLGVTLYEMLTGAPAFEADNVVGMLQQVLTFDPPSPHKLNKKIHRDVATICTTAMEKAPGRRYQTADEMSQDITSFLAGEPIEATPVGPIERGARKLRRHWKLVTANAAGIAFVVYLAHFYLSSRPSHVTVQVKPAGANVALDGSALSDNDLKEDIKLKPGKHRLLVELETIYDPQEIEFETKPGESRNLPVQLARRMGKLVVTTEPPDCGITILGADNFRAPFRGPKIEQELPTGRYSILVHKENYLAQDIAVNVETRATKTLAFNLPAITLWSTPTSGHVLGVPAVTDVDGDSYGDVIAGDDDGKLYCISGRNGVPLWVFKAQDSFQAPVSLADMNRDGVPDAIVGSTDKFLYCVDGRNGRQIWSFETKGPVVGPAMLKDVTSDGIPDVFFGSSDGMMYAIDGADARLLWSFQTGGRVDSALAWHRQGDADVLLVGSAGKSLYCFEPKQGELLWKVDAGVPLIFPVRIDDVDGSGKPLLLIPTPKTPTDVTTLVAISLTERKVVPTGSAMSQRMDLDGDGQPERLLVSAAGTLCYANDGKTLLWHSDYVAVTPSAADVNHDGWLDLVFNNGPDELLCISGKDGVLLGRIHLDNDVGRGFTLDDIDGDGIPDVVVGAARKVFCFSWGGGRKQWQVKSDAYFDAPLVTLEGKVYTKSVAGEIACYAPERAQPVWKLATSPQPSPYSALAVGKGMVVDADAQTRMVRALSAVDGGKIWEAKLPGESETPIGSPALGADCVVVGDGVKTLHCFNAKDGAPRWQSPIEKVNGSVAIGRDTVFVVGVAQLAEALPVQRLYCLALADGKERWQFTVTDQFPGPPALVDVNGDGVEDAIIANDGGMIYALSGKTGLALWQFQFSTERIRTRSRNRVVLADLTGDGFPEGIYATSKGDIFILDLKTGQKKRTITYRESIMSEPVVGDVDGDGIPEIIVGTMARKLHCIAGKLDSQLWSFEVISPVRFSAPAFLKDATGQPLIFVGTGPPENELYCLKGDAPRPGNQKWQGPWRAVTSVRK